MATTNAAITQTNNALKNLNIAANAQKQAEAGNNVAQNLSKMNTNLNKSSQGLQNAANKMYKLNMKNIGNKLMEASKAAQAAATAKAAQNATQAMNLLTNAMVKNLNLVNQGKPPANAAGVV
jgi:DNA anti-recombination protein RmuC